MNCPNCRHKLNIAELDNKYFIGRNSSGVPFFKCANCGQICYIDESNGMPHIASRGMKGSRLVPIVCGLLVLTMAFSIWHYFGHNLITWIINGVLLWIGGASIKIGLWGSRRLVDELTLDRNTKLSKQSDKEMKKFHKGGPKW